MGELEAERAALPALVKRRRTEMEEEGASTVLGHNVTCGSAATADAHGAGVSYCVCVCVCVCVTVAILAQGEGPIPVERG